MKKRSRLGRTDNELMRDVASSVGEHFTDYIVIGRIRDGIVWRMSDRTFAIGACRRTIKHLENDDRLAQEFPDE